MSGKTATPTGSALTDTEFFAPLVSAWQPQDDQSTHAAYTASDLMTAEGSATTGEDNTLHLSFTMNHRMALAVIEMPNTVKYKFTDERIPDYAVSPATTFSGIAQPLRVNDGTYRYLVNHATPAPTIEGHYDEGSKEFTITPSGLSTGSYKRYKVDGAVTTVKDYTMQRGDYLLADGNLLPKGTTLTEEQKASVAAIVFWTPAETNPEGRITPASLDFDKIMVKEHPNCTHGLAVSIKDAPGNVSWQNVNDWVADFQRGTDFNPVDKDEVDELNKKLEEAEKEKSKAATREELMERSYRMAAKYLNPDKDTVREKAVGEEPTEVVPVQRAEYQTTSGLSRPVTDSAFIASLTVERNYGFNTAVGSSYQMGTNTIAACISENQTIEQGGRVRLRLLQPLQAGSITVPENSLVTGAAVIQGERLDILISSIEYAGNIIPVQLATYDIDGQKGIFVPGSETRNAAKDAAGTVSESMGNSVSFARSAGQQVVMDLTRGVMQGGTRLIAGRVRAVKVTLKAGYKVLLVTKKQ